MGLLGLGFIFACVALFLALRRSRQDEEDRAWGAVVAQRYSTPELPEPKGQPGFGRLRRGRSAGRAYTEPTV